MKKSLQKIMYAFTMVINFINTVVSVVKLWNVNQKPKVRDSPGTVNRDSFTMVGGVRSFSLESHMGKQTLTGKWSGIRQAT